MKMKIPTVYGGPWVPATIQDILHNPVYVGKIRWNARPSVKRMVNGKIVKERPRAKDEDIIIADGIHEPIISIETWELAQKYLSENKEVPVPRRLQIKNPLAGLVICWKCGRRMVRRPYTNGQPDTLMCAITACDNVSSSLYIIEDMILNSLKEQLNTYRLEVKNIKKNNAKNHLEIDLIQKSTSNLDKEFETLKKQSDPSRLLEAGGYTVDTFLERAKLLMKKKKLQKRKAC